MLARFSLPPVCHDTPLSGGSTAKARVPTAHPRRATVEGHSENQRRRFAPGSFWMTLEAVSRLLLTHPGSVKEAPIQCEVGGCGISILENRVSRIEQEVQLVRDDCARHGKYERSPALTH